MLSEEPNSKEKFRIYNKEKKKDYVPMTRHQDSKGKKRVKGTTTFSKNEKVEKESAIGQRRMTEGLPEHGAVWQQ